MNRERAQQVANFRYGLIAPIVSCLTLHPGEVTALIEEASKKVYQIPFSTKNQVSKRTIERYLQAYRQGGYEALVPKYLHNNKVASRIPQEYLDKAVKLKREHSQRPISQIIQTLEMAGEVPAGVLKRSTVYDYFRRLGLDRKTQKASTKAYQRFTSKHRNERWQGDVCHLLHLPDAVDPKKKQKVYLIAWLDEASRLITHAQCYFEEKTFTLEDSLKKAIIKWGVPSQIYVDNGSVYSSKHLQSVCGRLGIRLSHSRPYRPQGRGKVERLFSNIQNSFLPEIQVLLQTQTLSLAELNEYLFIWIQNHYNEKSHSSIKQKPLVKFQGDSKPLRTVDLATLEDAFLVEKTRKPDKTAIFSLGKVEFQAPLEVAGQQITVRYNPYDPSRVQVYQGERRFDDAYPAVILENVEYTDEPRPTVGLDPSGLNYLHVLKEKAHREDPLSFSRLRGDR